MRGYLGLAFFVLLVGAGCALQRPSPWKVHGGAKECIEMCKGWDLEFAGMVGVGDQGNATDGASACICQRKSAGATAELLQASAAAAASMAAPIAAQRAATAAAEAGGP